MPWSINDCANFFYTHCYGLYSWIIGNNLNNIWISQLPQLRKYLSDADYTYYKDFVESNWNGL